MEARKKGGRKEGQKKGGEEGGGRKKGGRKEGEKRGREESRGRKEGGGGRKRGGREGHAERKKAGRQKEWGMDERMGDMLGGVLFVVCSPCSWAFVAVCVHGQSLVVIGGDHCGQWLLCIIVECWWLGAVIVIHRLSMVVVRRKEATLHIMTMASRSNGHVRSHVNDLTCSDLTWGSYPEFHFFPWNFAGWSMEFMESSGTQYRLIRHNK